MKKRVWTAMPIFYIFVAVLVFMTVAMYQYSKLLSIICGIVSLAALVVVLIFTLNFRLYMRNIVQAANSSMYDISDKYIDSIKLPVAVVGEHGEIVLFNSKFKKIFFDYKSALNQSIYPCIEYQSIETALESDSVEISFDNKKFQVLARKVSKGVMLTFIDNTYYKSIEKELADTKKSAALIVFDNAEDFNTDNEEEAIQVTILVENTLQKWANSNDSLYRKLSDSRYLIIFDEKTLREQINKKFDILDEVRKISFNGRQATISAGIGRNCENLKVSQQNAKKALDMSLGRGGDQIAVLEDGDYSFFGGVSKGVEKTSKVRVRVISESIRELLKEADNVLIMGHKYSDLDCIGSAAGLYCVIKNKFHIDAHIVTDVNRSLARPMIDYLSVDDEDMFVNSERAMLYLHDNTLLFIVDTHSPDFIESKNVLGSCSKKVIIDHHRRMVNYIDDSQVTFLEPTSSSSAELVTELVSYLGDDAITYKYAEALLAGIMLDTKNFVLKTGVRTFEAAAYLRKKGADTVHVRDVFSNSLENYKDKSELVSKAEIVNNCAITIEDKNIKNSRVVCAQAADDLLSIEEVYASFVISMLDSTTVNISARSFGKMNVQLIMEKLGGGGHQTMAAAQFSNISLEGAKEKLVKVLKEESE